MQKSDKNLVLFDAFYLTLQFRLEANELWYHFDGIRVKQRLLSVPFYERDRKNGLTGSVN